MSNPFDCYISDEARLKRKRLLIASALFEYIENDRHKPFEHQSGNNVEEMTYMLETEFGEFVDMLHTAKDQRHKNLKRTIRAINSEED